MKTYVLKNFSEDILSVLIIDNEKLTDAEIRSSLILKCNQSIRQFYTAKRVVIEAFEGAYFGYILTSETTIQNDVYNHSFELVETKNF